jgi:hypothetical protein
MRVIAQLSAASCIALLSLGPALAQSAATDEAIAPNGAVRQSHAFTAEQRHVIYAAVIRQKTRVPADRVPAAVGAAVPVAVELRDLPDPASDGVGTAPALKYALVDSDVVVVDPLAMRVVDVIRGGARP